MLLFLKNSLGKIEKQTFVFRNWIKTFLAIIGLRVFEEELLTGFNKTTLFDFLAFFGHTLFFFLLSFLLFLFVLNKILKQKIEKTANVLLWGLGIILLPPILDKLYFQNQFVWSFYLFTDFWGLIKKFFLFFGDNWKIGITLGTRIEVFLVVLFLSSYIFFKKKKKKWFFCGLILFYGLLYVLGSFPSVLTFFVNFFQKNKSFLFLEKDVVNIFLTPVTVFGLKDLSGNSILAWKMFLIYHLLVVFSLIFLQKLLNQEKFYALLKNVRFPQMVFNSGLFLFGLGIGGWIFPYNLTKDIFSFLVVLNLWIAVFSAWFYSVLVNDEEDLLIDEKTNAQRPLIKKIFSIEEYREYRLIFFFFSLFFPLLMGWKFFFLFLIYHILTFLYSCPPFRLKRFIGIASFLSALASVIFLLIGFCLVAEGQNLIRLPWELVIFLFLILFLLIPLKDLKDIEGDRLVKVWTLPVLIGEYRARLLLAVLFLGSYLFSVYIFREESLFLPAVFLGSGSFWLIVNKKISPHFLLGWVIFLIFIYFIFLLKVFLVR